jgi:hypothetical protein
MPIYFNQVAPYCPIANDQPSPLDQRVRIRNTRSTVPPAFDLPSAINAANIARSIVTSVTQDKTVNNTSTKTSKDTPPKDKMKTTRSRWAEVKDQRIRRKYKYYAKKADGTDDKSTWVLMERIERMVWHDRGWNANLVFEYGDKGEGEPAGDFIFGG